MNGNDNFASWKDRQGQKQKKKGKRKEKRVKGREQGPGENLVYTWIKKKIVSPYY